MKTKFNVSAYVISIGDENEIDVYLQSCEKENCYDYDIKLNAFGKKAIALENNIEIGDKIVIDIPDNWDTLLFEGGED